MASLYPICFLESTRMLLNLMLLTIKEIFEYVNL